LLDAFAFDQPQYLRLLVVPAVLLCLWIWQLLTRMQDVRRLSRRTLPVAERFSPAGDLLFWLAVILASSGAILALARPSARVSLVRTAGIDLVVLQDASASMRVRDTSGDRWQRSTRFLRMLGDTLRWRDDRAALALFARIAAPQVRLTRDPTTFFFFLDHLGDEPPFRLENDTTWYSNVEEGLHWGLRLIEKDAEINGPSPNIPAFVVVSDGDELSGELTRALEDTRARDVPVFVVGVGSVTGGVIPEGGPDVGRLAVSGGAAIHSAIDRGSLRAIADTGGGRYFELDRDGDLEVANLIVDETRRRAGPLATEERQPLYWWFLAASAALLAPGVLFLGEPADVCLQLFAAVSAAVVIIALAG